MTIHIVDDLGGPTAVAELLKLTGQPGYRQRIDHWRKRGIPAKVLLEHGATIERALRARRRAAELEACAASPQRHPHA